MQPAKVNDKGKVRVFVYGTLKLNHANALVMSKAKAQFIGHDCIRGLYDFYDLGGFPAVVDGKEDNLIKGHLFCMDEEGLAALDHLEGHPNFYRRRKVWTVGHEKRAWVYVLQNDTYLRDENLITDGLWRPSDLELAFWKGQKEKPTLACFTKDTGNADASA
jgi:gamma-glutamylcyclotransferase (GGCT)/AIG2-like uncharacterized protein YtfP